MTFLTNPFQKSRLPTEKEVDKFNTEAVSCEKCKYLLLKKDSSVVEHYGDFSFKLQDKFYCKKCAPDYDVYIYNNFEKYSFRGTPLRDGENYIKKQPGYYAVDKNGKKLK